MFFEQIPDRPVRLYHLARMGILVDDTTLVSPFGQAQVDSISVSVIQPATNIGILSERWRVKEKEIDELIIWIEIKISRRS